MAAGVAQVPDWKNGSAYEPLLDADRSLFAWEWLRRDRHYRAAAKRALEVDGNRSPIGLGEAPERWGLHAFEPPGLTALDARPVWLAEVHPYVLDVHAGPQDGEDVFDLERFSAISTLLKGADDREHLLISDGIRSLRIDVLSGSVKDGPSQLRYMLAGFASAERPLLTLRRLLMLWRTGRFSAALHAAEAKTRRSVLTLRTHDALDAGADQREIAAVLLSDVATERHWRSHSPSLRSQVQRLVRGARRMASGGYLDLLS